MPTNGGRMMDPIIISKIVLVDDGGFNLHEFGSGKPARGMYYTKFCQYLAKQFPKADNIVLILGDGYYTYKKTENSLNHSQSKKINFPKSLTDTDTVDELINSVVGEIENCKNTLFFIDNRLSIEDTDINNGMLATALINEVINKNGYAIRYTSFPDYLETSIANKNYLGCVKQLSIHSPSIAAKAFALHIKREGD